MFKSRIAAHARHLALLFAFGCAIAQPGAWAAADLSKTLLASAQQASAVRGGHSKGAQSCIDAVAIAASKNSVGDGEPFDLSYAVPEGDFSCVLRRGPAVLRSNAQIARPSGTVSGLTIGSDAEFEMRCVIDANQGGQSRSARVRVDFVPGRKPIRTVPFRQPDCAREVALLSSKAQVAEGERFELQYAIPDTGYECALTRDGSVLRVNSELTRPTGTVQDQAITADTEYQLSCSESDGRSTVEASATAVVLVVQAPPPPPQGSFCAELPVGERLLTAAADRNNAPIRSIQTYGDLFGTFPLSEANQGAAYRVFIARGTYLSLPFTVPTTASDDATIALTWEDSPFGSNSTIVSVSSCIGGVLASQALPQAPGGFCHRVGRSSGGNLRVGVNPSLANCVLQKGQTYYLNVMDYSEAVGTTTCPSSECTWLVAAQAIGAVPGEPPPPPPPPPPPTPPPPMSFDADALELDVVAAGRFVRRQLAVVGPVTFLEGSPSRLEAIVPDTLLCTERPGAMGTELKLEDANGQPGSFLGIEDFTYAPSTRILRLDPSAGLLCFTPTDDPVASLAPARASDDPVPCEDAADRQDLLLRDGFEATPAPGDGPASIQLDLRLVRAPSLDDAASLLYEYVVQNCGDRPLENVALREFWPGSGGSAPVRLVQSSSWEVCGESQAECGPTVSGGTGYVDLEIGTLWPRGAFGSRVVIRADRPIDRGLAGDLVRIDAVALVNTPGAGLPEHASRSWGVEILQVGNAEPKLLVAAGPLPTPQNPVALVEDEGTTVITSPSTFLLRVEDGDSGFDCAAGCLAVTSSDDSVIAPAGVRPVFVPQPDSFSGRLDLEITPRENGSGAVTLTIAAVDREGGVSEPIELSFAVEGRNDPPVFRIGAGGSFPSSGAKAVVPGKSVVIVPEAFCELVQATPQGPLTLEDPACPTHRWPSVPAFPDDLLVYENWISGLQAGPGSETAGTVTLDVSIAEDPAGIFRALAFDAQTGRLDYLLSGATGSASLAVVARDAEGLETAVEVAIIVQDSDATASHAPTEQ